ncbi:MAG: hypothetical protein AB7W16_15425 [Candidatus Obscuribacterales bacterium]
MPSFENFFDKVKSATGKTAKLAKLKMNVVTLTSEKNKHLQAIGQRVYNLFAENHAIDGNVLKENVREEISQIERIDEKIREHEAEIADLQSNTQHVDVTDVTDGAENN